MCMSIVYSVVVSGSLLSYSSLAAFDNDCNEHIIVGGSYVRDQATTVTALVAGPRRPRDLSVSRRHRTPCAWRGQRGETSGVLSE